MKYVLPWKYVALSLAVMVITSLSTPLASSFEWSARLEGLTSADNFMFSANLDVQENSQPENSPGDPPDGILFSDNFDDGDAAGWTVFQGDWQVVNGEYIYGSRGISGVDGVVAAGDSSWTDYVFESKFKLIEGDPQVYVLFRFTNYIAYEIYDGYSFQYMNDRWALLRWRTSYWPYYDIIAVEQNPSTMAPGEWYDVKVEVSGDHMMCYINGELKIEAFDSTYSRGRIGFRGNANKLAFDDVVVRPPRVDTTPPISSVNTFEGDAYWQVKAPFTVTATASDDLSGVASVELWYRYSWDNLAWGTWENFGTDTAGVDGWSWNLTAPDGYGYYKFLSIATDRAGNTEVKEPKEAEAGCVAAVDIETALGRPPNVDFTNGGVNTSIGSFTYQAQDISVSGALPVSFVRTYNSRDDYIGPFGMGWTHSYNLRILVDGSRITLVNEDGKRDVYFLEDGRLVPLVDTYAELVFDPTNADETYVLIRPGGTKFYFNWTAKLAKIVDRDGNGGELEYEGELLKRIKEKDSGRTLLEFIYEGGRIIGINDNGDNPRWVRYSYDLDGNLYSNSSLTGESYVYTYHNDKLIGITQPERNRIIFNTYDENGGVIEQVDGAGSKTTLSYSPGQTVVTDNAGNSASYDYNPFYQTVKEVDPLGYSTRYSFDGGGNLTKIIDKAGNQTLLFYDATGNLTNVTEKDGGTFTLTYDQGNIVRTIDPLSSSTELGYDSRGRLISLTNPMGNTFSLGYNEKGNLMRITDAKNNATTVTYDEGDRVRVRDAEGHESVYEYDRFGRLGVHIDPRNNTTDFSYYADGSIASIANALGGSTRYVYDKNGNLATVHDPNGNPASYEYDDMNRLTRVTPAPGLHATEYRYNHLGMLSDVTDARGNWISYDYDARGDLIIVTDQLDRTASFSHYPNGNVNSQTDAMGRTTGYVYDAGDRVVNVTYPDGSVASFSYNLLGKLAEASRGNQQATLTYDALGRITGFNFTSQSVRYYYDEVGLLNSTYYPGGHLNFTYDRNYNLKSVRENGGERWAEYSYDAAGNPTKATLSNGTEVRYEWDALNRLTKVTTLRTSDGRVLTSFEYAYDSNGNRIAENRTIGGSRETLEYRYDRLNQLIEVIERNWRRTYLYDALGNRLRVTETRQVGRRTTEEATTYEYDAANQLLRIVRPDGRITAFAYDGNGNMIGEVKLGPSGSVEENMAYTYDFDDRLVRVEKSSGGGAKLAVEYEYDPLGNRAARRQYRLGPDGGRTEEDVIYYVNDVSGPLAQVLATFGAGGEPLQRFMYGVNRVAASGQQGYYYVYDGLGSVAGLVDESGEFVARYSYDEWGVPQRWSPGLNTFGFAGEDYDPVTGLVFLRARYYKPDVGRFLTQDDALGPMTDPLSWNPYIYARNSPVTLTDPSGKFWWFIFAIFLVGFTGGTVYHGVTTGQWLSWETLGWGLAGGFLALAAAAAPALAAKGIVWLGTHLGFNVTATSLKVVVASGIIAGGTMGFASRVVFNILQGKDWNEGLIESVLIGMALGGLVGATGYYAGLSIASVGGSATYVFVGRKIITSVLRETVRYESKYIEWIYARRFR